MRVTVAADGFLHPDHTPAMPHELDFVPYEDRAALAASAARSAALVTRRAVVDDALLAEAPGLKLVQQVGVGTDRIDLAAAARRGVAVANTPGAPTDAVVEHTFLLILAALRGLPRQIETVGAGGWSGLEVWSGREIGGSTLGVVGYGSIGRGVARRAVAFGARVLATTRTPPAEVPEGVRFVDLPVLLRASDVVVLAPALTPQTRGMIGRAELASMKTGALLVNVSRGAVIDEGALLAVLAEGRLRGAALDAFTTEPLPPDSPFRTLPNVLATPHTAGSTVESRARIWAQMAANLDRLANGQPLASVVSAPPAGTPGSHPGA